MPNITLPDGSVKKYNKTVTIAEVAKDIGEGLARAALAGKIQDQLVDLSYEIIEDTSLSIITSKSPESLDILRHSAAHLLAHAVKNIFPEAQVTIGPIVEDGFYYDFSYKRPFTPDDIARIEKKMNELSKENIGINRKVIQRQAAIDYFKSIGEIYKSEIISSIPEGEELSLYEQGDFTDLCRGPHVPSTGKIKVFKLMKLAGAYWRGDSKNEMLQRIYGTAWNNKDELKDYLTRLEEAEKRDHRKLGKLLNLFHMQDTSPGMVFWHAKGWSIWLEIENYLRQKFLDYGYDEIKTPTVLDKELWKSSGHWDNYHENMFTTASENREYAVKPMNCPGHVQIFNSNLHSYRDLPLRLAEFGSCHRNEPSGALHGLLRVRGFTQDDAHIFCTEDQIKSEVKDFSKMLYETYADFGFNNVLVMLSTRPEKRVGSDDIWEKAELALEDALKETGIEYTLQEGEGAFYGPKIEYSLKDSLGRIWQCGTIQLDFNLPERLGAEYIAEDNSRKNPVMLHRAIVGSMERFIGILIEHYAGFMPLWLAPVQVIILNIADAHREYTEEVTEALKLNNIRCNSDLRNEKITYKIREHSIQRVPYLLVIGDREKETKQVAVRNQKGEDLGSMTVESLIKILKKEICDKS
ncbi:MAG: threonine--tRNA ligase [Nitrosomonadales bacterium]|jgi:threonyl-tRNA synthetase|nr:threonine--tRNA ligase [Nitrosomonadales bacterium]MBT4571581.1 threonine--tRNA ligase [Nitrosomonadales bacterium]MBT6015403.1 threonine--tRNA ligase [Nitrosomonadales bacterium]MBT6250665.1 threonine--tRNA ligase [Nitrosomonadales bacterium]MBT6602471.1 threonine--tRNA ligase [Nitrosomonadales bacterium]